jgi:hypothetical protein
MYVCNVCNGCMYVCMYTCNVMSCHVMSCNVCMCMYMCMCMCIRICVHMYICIFMYLCKYVFMYFCMYVYLHLCIYAHLIIYIYILKFCLCIYMCVYLYLRHLSDMILFVYVSFAKYLDKNILHMFTMIYLFIYISIGLFTVPKTWRKHVLWNAGSSLTLVGVLLWCLDMPACFALFCLESWSLFIHYLLQLTLFLVGGCCHCLYLPCFSCF